MVWNTLSMDSLFSRVYCKHLKCGSRLRDSIWSFEVFLDFHMHPRNIFRQKKQQQQQQLHSGAPVKFQLILLTSEISIARKLAFLRYF